jgi:hypothetical protein
MSAHFRPNTALPIAKKEIVAAVGKWFGRVGKPFANSKRASVNESQLSIPLFTI